MDIPSPCPVINLTMYGTLPICTVIFGIGDGAESAERSLLAKSYAQFVSLAAWYVP